MNGNHRPGPSCGMQAGLHVLGTSVPVLGQAFLLVINRSRYSTCTDMVAGTSVLIHQIGEDNARDSTGKFIARGENYF